MEASWLLDTDMIALKVNRWFCFIRNWSQLPPSKFLMLGKNQTKTIEQIFEEWEESYVSINLATIKSHSELWHIHLTLLLWAFRMGKTAFPPCLTPQCVQSSFQGCYMLPQPDIAAGPGARSPTHCPEMWFWFGLCGAWGSCAELPWGRKKFGQSLCNTMQV